MQSTVDGGRERSLEAMADCAAMMICAGGASAGAGASSSSSSAAAAAAHGNAWASWTAEARLTRFVHAGNWPL